MKEVKLLFVGVGKIDMPSISPVHALSVGEDDQEKNDGETISPRKPGSPGSTFGERLKAARKRIPSHPGRAKMVRSTSESSGSTINTSNERMHHGQANGESSSSIRDFRTFFREHSIMMEL